MEALLEETRMRITISGPPGSGKTTACTKLAETLGLQAVVFGKVFRQLAAEKNISLVELGELAEKDPSIDADIDARIVETARNNPDIILESRLSAYMLDRNDIPALKVYLDASPEVRVARIGGREDKDLTVAVEETRRRQESEAKRYLMYYGIDISDLSVYDLVINTDVLTPDEVLERILDAVRIRNMLVKDPKAIRDRWGIRPSDRSTGELLKAGVIALDKPEGPTSHQATAWARDALRCERIGHGGTLDPGVSGVLPICTGKAVRLTDVVLSSDKEYVCLMTLHGDRSEAEIRHAMAKFVGRIYQLPPVRSAVKRKLRIRRIKELEVLQVDGRKVLYRIVCDAGTYVRSLCVDIGDLLLCGASMTELRRTRSGRMRERDSATLHDLADAYVAWQQEGRDAELRRYIKPMEVLVKPIPWVIVKATAVDAVCHGADLSVKGVHLLDPEIRKNALVAMMTIRGEIIGLGSMAMSSEKVMASDSGVAVRTVRVLMEPGHYPSMWKQATDLEGLPSDICRSRGRFSECASNRFSITRRLLKAFYRIAHWTEYGTVSEGGGRFREDGFPSRRAELRKPDRHGIRQRAPLRVRGEEEPQTQTLCQIRHSHRCGDRPFRQLRGRGGVPGDRQDHRPRGHQGRCRYGHPRGHMARRPRHGIASRMD